MAHKRLKRLSHPNGGKEVDLDVNSINRFSSRPNAFNKLTS